MPANWTDHPYYYKGYMFIYKPTPVVQAVINENVIVDLGFGAGFNTHILTDAPTLGALSDIQHGMTLTIGTTAGGWDLGIAYALGIDSTTVPGNTFIMVWAADGIRYGELHPSVGKYLTVWNDYRAWGIAPCINPVDGTPFRDQSVSPAHVFAFPVAKCGPGYAKHVNGSNVIDVAFDASGTYRVDTGALVTGAWTFPDASSTTGSGNVYSSVQFPKDFRWAKYAATVSDYVAQTTTRAVPVYAATDALAEASYTGGTAAASTGTAVNAFDNDTGTYWEPSSLPGYVTMEFPRKTKVAGYSITANTFGAGATTTISTSTAQQQPVGKVTLDTWEAQSFTPSATGILSQFTVKHAANSGTPSGTITWRICADNAGNPGTILQTGTYTPVASTTNTITVTGGIELATSTTYWLVLKSTNTQSTNTYWRIYSSSTSDYADGASKYSTNGGSTWNSTSYDLSITVTTTAANYSPSAWTVSGYNTLTSTYELLDSRSGEAFTTGQTRTFTLDDTLITTFAYYTKYRLNVTAGNTSTVRVVEWNLLSPDNTIRNFEVTSHEFGMDGQRYTFKVNEPFELSEYMDGALVMYWEREFYNGVEGSLSGPTGREHVKFIGWIDTESHNTQAEQYDTSTGVTIDCVDVGKRLQQLGTFPFTLGRDAAPANWTQQAGLNLDRFIWYILRWCSTALNLADFTWSGTLDTYGVTQLTAQGSNVYEVADYCARAMAARLVCDKFGQFGVKRDPQYLTSTAISLVTQTNASSTRDAWVALSGPATAKTKLSQSFKVGTTAQINKLTLFLVKTGSPTGTATVRVETDNSGDPSGTLAHANATATFAESGVDGTGADQIVTFATAWTPAANTTYHIVLSTSRSPSGTNYISWGADGSAPGYALGEMKSYTAAWAAESKDACFEVYQNVVPARDETPVLTLTEADYTKMDYSRAPFPRTHWLWGNALLSSTKDADDGTWTPTPLFSVSPARAPGQGTQSADQSEQVVVNQDELNARMGQQYALRLNGIESMRTITLAHAGDYVLNPADQQYIAVTVTGAHADVRGETLSAEPMLLHSVRIDHDHDAQTKTVTIEVERAVDGLSARTYVPLS